MAARVCSAQVMLDIARLAPDPARMNVLEARPLFLYSGEWRWIQPWLFFRTGFFIGVVALIPFARPRVARRAAWRICCCSCLRSRRSSRRSARTVLATTW